MPDLETFGSAFLTDGTFAHTYLNQSISERNPEIVDMQNFKYGFLHHLSMKQVENTMHFMLHNLSLSYDNLPGLLSHCPELLQVLGASSRTDIISPEIKDRRKIMVEIISYLQKLDLDPNDIIQGVAGRSLIETKSIEDFDYLMYKMSKINILDSPAEQKTKIFFSNQELGWIGEGPEKFLFLEIGNYSKKIGPQKKPRKST